MPSNPDQPPEANPHPVTEIIPAGSMRWVLQWMGLIAAVFVVFWLSSTAILTHLLGGAYAAKALSRMLPFQLIPVLILLLSPWMLRWLESQLHHLPVRPGGGPQDQETAVKMGLASCGFPLNSGALVLTPQELVFYRRRYRQWAEEMRIPLEQIIAVETQRGLPHPKLRLQFSNGGHLKFRALRVDRWRDAILEVKGPV